MKKFKQGFSLVEAIVALVILSLVFSAIWGWFGTAARSTTRIEQALALPEVFSQFVVNLELEPLEQVREGVFVIGEHQVLWRASLIKQSDKRPYRRQPAWIVSLFNIEADVQKDGRVISSFTTGSVRQWRDPNYIDANEGN
jgi:prepilin-type N-terminal cleavage/methylation domain-containing protein